MLTAASLSGIGAGSLSLRATVVAVAGISCIRPRAPAGLSASASKLLSWRIRPSVTAGSTASAARPAPASRSRPAAMPVPPGPPRGGDGLVRQAELGGKPRRQGAVRLVVRQLVQPLQEGLARRGSPQAASSAAARANSLPAKSSARARVPGRVGCGPDARGQAQPTFAQRQGGELAVIGGGPGGGLPQRAPAPARMSAAASGAAEPVMRAALRDRRTPTARRGPGNARPRRRDGSAGAARSSPPGTRHRSPPCSSRRQPGHCIGQRVVMVRAAAAGRAGYARPRTRPAARRARRPRRRRRARSRPGQLVGRRLARR